MTWDPGILPKHRLFNVEEFSREEQLRQIRENFEDLYTMIGGVTPLGRLWEADFTLEASMAATGDLAGKLRRLADSVELAGAMATPGVAPQTIERRLASLEAQFAMQADGVSRRQLEQHVSDMELLTWMGGF